jgi:hypothetical protein
MIDGKSHSVKPVCPGGRAEIVGTVGAERRTEETTMIRGSCLCGGVKFEIDSAVSDMTDCHCSMCRKAHGASFVTWVSSNRDDFRWVQGEDLITRYASSAAFERLFCRVCGSNLPLYYAKLDELAVPAGILDDDPGVRLEAHIFVGSKAPWVEISGDVECFDEYPPGDA